MSWASKEQWYLVTAYAGNSVKPFMMLWFFSSNFEALKRAGGKYLSRRAAERSDARKITFHISEVEEWKSDMSPESGRISRHVGAWTWDRDAAWTVHHYHHNLEQ